MASVFIIASQAQSLLNFRGELIAALQANGQQVLAAAPDCPPEFKAKLTAAGIAFFPIPMARTGMNMFADITTLRAIYRLLRAHRPERVLAYTIKPVVYGMLAARMAGIAKRYALVTGLGYAFTSESRRLTPRLLQGFVSALYRIALRGCAGVIFQNPDDQQFFETQAILTAGVPRHMVNGSGVNLDFFAPQPLPTGAVFLMVARLLRDKGVREYAAAARAVKQRCPEAVCRLVGPFDSNPSAVSEAEVQGWVSEGIIEYLGALADIRPAMAGASVFVLPSYREGTPRSVLEAMAMGRAIITTDVPGCRETVREGVNGLLVRPRESDGLAAAMEQLARDAAARAVMGEQSLVLAREKYEVHAVNRQMLAIMGVGDLRDGAADR